MAYVVTLMSAFILIAVIWAGLLDKRLRQQTGFLAKQSQEDAIRQRRMARQEQQRSRILELISSSAPLPEVLREIQTMVSSRLYGASCWFELRGSASDGVGEERPSGPGTVFEELFSHEGTSLGLLLAIPLLHGSAEADISEALTAGARLAELAIDTRRLYSDLRHRSEYDLLTEIPNRFSMDRHLDKLMVSARSTEAVFGLVYVDLDRFKQVNDRYGHRIGDLYLQEVTRRMKLQLRAGDVLARIGGDEFIALVPILHTRADAEEIAMRLEHCFDEPFELEDVRLTGSASVGLAVYPEDGATKEELQRHADGAMYAHKESKRDTRFGKKVRQLDPLVGDDSIR
jgi:diguanylate cyclase (GGDEF)-like protein